MCLPDVSYSSSDIETCGTGQSFCREAEKLETLYRLFSPIWFTWEKSFDHSILSRPQTTSLPPGKGLTFSSFKPGQKVLISAPPEGRTRNGKAHILYCFFTRLRSSSGLGITIVFFPPLLLLLYHTFKLPISSPPLFFCSCSQGSELITTPVPQQHPFIFPFTCGVAEKV